MQQNIFSKFALAILFSKTILLSVGCQKASTQNQVPDDIIQQKNIAKIHAHNDYEKKVPLYDAYNQKVASIEADIWWNPEKDTALLLGHFAPNNNTILKKMYIEPIVALFEKNKATVSADPQYSFVLMLDIKSEAYSTLTQVVKELAPYQKYFDRAINKNAVQIVISGNRPTPNRYNEFPNYIYFDGRPSETYDSVALSRIGFISDNVSKYADSTARKAVVKKSNDMGKDFRFWGTPDDSTTWKTLYHLSDDHKILINSDKVADCSAFFDEYLK